MRILSLRSGFCLLYSVIACWMSSAHSTPWRADPKLIMKPSPRPLIRRPACRLTLSSMIVSYDFMISCEAVKPRVESSRVDSSTSVNMIVTVPSVWPTARLPMMVSAVSGAAVLMG